ncbi:MAG: hypothetical protein ACRDZ7_22620, partial [Acidimicrobiia bacterium]
MRAKSGGRITSLLIALSLTLAVADQAGVAREAVESLRAGIRGGLGRLDGAVARPLAAVAG